MNIYILIYTQNNHFYIVLWFIYKIFSMYDGSYLQPQFSEVQGQLGLKRQKLFQSLSKQGRQDGSVVRGKSTYY